VTRTKNNLVNTGHQKCRVFEGFCIPKKAHRHTRRYFFVRIDLLPRHCRQVFGKDTKTVVGRTGNADMKGKVSEFAMFLLTWPRAYASPTSRSSLFENEPRCRRTWGANAASVRKGAGGYSS
jgi:hypothetical protein